MLIYPATIDGMARIKFDEPEIVAAELSRIIGKRVRVEIIQDRHKRSDAQNRMGWGHVYKEAVADATDWVITASGMPVLPDRDAVHRFGKANLLLAPTETNRGVVHLMGSTTQLSTAEYSEYIDRVCAKLAGYGVYVPPVGTL